MCLFIFISIYLRTKRSTQQGNVNIEYKIVTRLPTDGTALQSGLKKSVKDALHNKTNSNLTILGVTPTDEIKIYNGKKNAKSLLHLEKFILCLLISLPEYVLSITKVSLKGPHFSSS